MCSSQNTLELQGHLNEMLLVCCSTYRLECAADLGASGWIMGCNMWWICFSVESVAASADVLPDTGRDRVTQFPSYCFQDTFAPARCQGEDRNARIRWRISSHCISCQGFGRSEEKEGERTGKWKQVNNICRFTGALAPEYVLCCSKNWFQKQRCYTLFR